MFCYYESERMIWDKLAGDAHTAKGNKHEQILYYQKN